MAHSHLLRQLTIVTGDASDNPPDEDPTIEDEQKVQPSEEDLLPVDISKMLEESKHKVSKARITVLPSLRL